LLRTEVAQLDNKQSDLEKAKIALSDYANEQETLSLVLPEDKDQARVVKEIYAIADQSNVRIDSVAFPSSTLGEKAAAKPVPTTTDTATDASAQNPGTSAATKDTKPTKTISQATPVKSIPGVQSILLSLGTITSKDSTIKGVRYDEMMSLIRLLERNRRTMQIQSIGIGQSKTASGESTYDLSLSIVIFIQP
jgi:hypothetical protein